MHELPLHGVVAAGAAVALLLAALALGHTLLAVLNELQVAIHKLIAFAEEGLRAVKAGTPEAWSNVTALGLEFTKTLEEVESSFSAALERFLAEVNATLSGT